MFSFMDMYGTYEERKVDRYEDGVTLKISTASVTDSDRPYETAVSHQRYGGKWVIVEDYDNKEDAQKGHDRWVKKMTAKKLPAKLTDVSTCEFAKLMPSEKKDKVRS